VDAQLTIRERKALISLGRFGPGAAFDQIALGKLFSKGLVEVESRSHRIVLTARGRDLYTQFLGDQSGS